VLRDSDAQQVTPREALGLASGAQGTIVDLRTRLQHTQSSPPGSVSIPAGEPGMLGLLFHFREQFEADVLESVNGGLAPPLLLLCDVGVVSGVAASKLAAAGLANVRIISGGYEAWQMDASLPCDEPKAVGGGALDSELALEPFSLWAEDAGEHPCAPVLHIELGGEPVETELLDELDEEEEVAEAIAVDTKRRPSSGSSRDLDLAELERLLGDDGGVPPTLSAEAHRGAAPAAAAPQPADAAAPRRNSARSKYYAASTTSYGGPSRAPKGVKLRRTRGGLPPAWLVDIEHLNMAVIIEEDTLSSLSIKELKSFLYYRDAILSGPKRVLVDRIKDVWRQEQAATATPTPPPAESASASAGQPGDAGPTAIAAGGERNGASSADAARPDVVGGEAADAAGGGLLEGPGGLLGAADPSAPGPHDDFLIDEVFSAM